MVVIGVLTLRGKGAILADERSTFARPALTAEILRLSIGHPGGVLVAVYLRRDPEHENIDARYARILKVDGAQSLDFQRDALSAVGVEQDNLYEDRSFGSCDDRQGAQINTACIWSHGVRHLCHVAQIRTVSDP